MPLESVLTMPAKNDPAQPARARDSNGSRRMRGIFLVVALVLIGSGVATYFFGRLLLDAIQALSLRQSEIDELREVLPIARREAKAAFGDENLLVEKYLLHARHIEFQVVAEGLVE